MPVWLSMRSVLATFFALASLLAFGVRPASAADSPAEKVTYQDHALPLFRNACLGCHNPDKKKAGLDLSTYQGALAGGDNGPVINAGDPSGSRLFKVVTHAEEPTMPPKKDKLPDKELDVIRKWIAGGALENASGKPALAARPKVDLTVVSAGIGRPTGPIAFPKSLAGDPVVRTERPGALISLANSPWAPLVAVGGQRQILLYHTQTLDLLGVLPFPEGLPYVLQFSRNGGVLLAGGGMGAKSGKVVLFDVNTGNRITEVGDEFDAVIAADISADQSIVALGGPNRVVKGYSVADGQLLYTIKKHTDWVTAVAFSPDGNLLATADRAGGISVWEAKTGHELFTLTGHKEGVSGLAFRDDSNLLASCSTDGTAKLWGMEEGKEVKSWAAHGNYRPPSGAVGAGTFDPNVGALSIAFTHDGRIVTCGRDKAVRLWDSGGGQGKALQPAFADLALHAAFDDEGKRVIAGDYTGKILVWTVADGKVAGELSLDPPTIAERLATAAKKLEEARPALEKALAEANERDEAAKRAADELRVLREAAASARATASEAETRAQATADAVTAAEEALRRAQAEAKAASETVAKARSDAEATSKLVRPKADAAKAAAEAAAKVKKAAEQAEGQLRELKYGVAKLKAAQAATELSKARKALADRESEQAALADAVKAAKAAAEKAAADAKSFEKALPDAPKRLKASQEALEKAKAAAAASKAAVDAATEDAKQRETLAQQATDLARNTAAVTARAKDDKSLADAAEKAKAAAEALTANFTAAKQAVTARSDAAKKAADEQAAAEQALTKAKDEAANGRKILADMKKAAETAAAEVPKKQDAAEAAADPVREAKAKVAQLEAEHERLDREAQQLATPATAANGPATQPVKS